MKIDCQYYWLAIDDLVDLAEADSVQIKKVIGKLPKTFSLIVEETVPYLNNRGYTKSPGRSKIPANYRYSGWNLGRVERKNDGYFVLRTNRNDSYPEYSLAIDNNTINELKKLKEGYVVVPKSQLEKLKAAGKDKNESS